MAKGNFSATSCIREHLDITYKKTKPETRDKYAAVLYNINAVLKENNQITNPREINEDTIRFLLKFWENLAVSTRHWYLHILNRYLKFFKNEIIENMRIDVGVDTRPNVDWLSDEEADLVLHTKFNELIDVAIHLELCMGLRVSEVVNLRLDQIHFDDDPEKCYIHFRGKGTKYRAVPFHPLSDEIFKNWLERRKSYVSSIKNYNPMWVDPGTFLIWCHYKDKPTGGKFTERGHSLDRAVIHKVREHLGMNFTNHTLRRTFGRNLHKSGVDIETIAEIFGHKDTRTTLLYLGIDNDDMRKAIALGHKRQEKISSFNKNKKPKKEEQPEAKNEVVFYD